MADINGVDPITTYVRPAWEMILQVVGFIPQKTSSKFTSEITVLYPKRKGKAAVSLPTTIFQGPYMSMLVLGRIVGFIIQ